MPSDSIRVASAPGYPHAGVVVDVRNAEHDGAREASVTVLLTQLEALQVVEALLEAVGPLAIQLGYRPYPR